jgi:GPCR-Autoproteolysis INducing (GAIN) domain
VLNLQGVLLNIVRSASNLLDLKNREAWYDLEAGPQLRLASSLLLALQENALLFAEVTAQPEKLIESSYNICKLKSCSGSLSS